MKKIIKLLGALSLVAASFTSCERDISALNVDPKNPSVVPTENLVSTVSYYLANAHVSPALMKISPDFSLSNGQKQLTPLKQIISLSKEIKISIIGIIHTEKC